ncbi:MAG: type II secretion system protein GspI [Rubrivivax sp.]|nr:MAG: type II secretion system protein GspI [Rubrivivax sp.]
MTLIEVLVALAIVAITLAAGIKAAGGLTLNAQRVADLTVGQWCAENQLAALKLAESFPPVGDGEFQCEQLGRVFKGKQAVRPTVNAENFRRIEVQVLDEEGRSVVKVVTVLPRP